MFLLKEKAPKAPDQKKKLTYYEDGSSNNTIIQVDGYGNLFGVEPGKVKMATQLKDNKLAWESTWDYTEKSIRVVQHVEIVRGEQSQKLDTCLVWYRVENYAAFERKVGVRIMLDTYIGANDGVPFLIPGRKELLTDMHDFGEKEIPDYIEALEKPDLSNPGTVAHLGLKGISLAVPKQASEGKEGATTIVDPEPIVRMLICYWPGGEVRWELEPERIRSIKGDRDKGEGPDSCVFLYWPYRVMAPKEVRFMAFTYGLGQVYSDIGQGKLAVTVGGSFVPEGEFTVTAYVSNPTSGQTVTLTLPEGFEILDDPARRNVPMPSISAVTNVSPVTWRVLGPRQPGTYRVKVESNTGVSQGLPLKIQAKGIFGN
jgi:hypothetical protein